MKAAALILISVLPTLAACGKPAAPGVSVADPWCRAASAGAPTGACYAVLTAAAADRLIAVETPAAERAEVHAMDMEGGVMRMRKLDGVPLAQGQATAFAPGAMHFMIIRPKAPMSAGSSLPLILKFEKAPPQTVAAPVK